MADDVDQPPGSSAPDSAQEYLGHFVPFHLYRVTTRAAALASADYRNLGINVPEARLLMVVLMAPGMSAGELSELLCIERSLLSHMLRHLAAKELVRRDRDAVHRRSVRVSLTPAGEACARACRKISAVHENELVRGFTSQEQEILLTLLDRMYANIAHVTKQSS